ncbi:MAG: hypothetical protein WCJ18_00260 [Planctomycetota bacterium]
MTAPDQFISPEQWGAVKATVSMLNSAELQEDVDLPEWFYEFRDKLTELIVATTDPIAPFELSEHFAYLLDMYVAGSTLQSEVADGSQLVVLWAQETLSRMATMGIKPHKDGQKSIWLVVKALTQESELGG